MFVKLLSAFYFIIGFVIFYVKSNKINIIDIIIENGQAKNRKRLTDIKRVTKSDIRFSLLWPVLVVKYLLNEFKEYRNKHSKI